MALMERIAHRVTTERVWDQSVYNQEIFLLTHGSKPSVQVTVRVMDIDKFVNSKTLFLDIRKKPVAEQKLPVMVHVNYHADKVDRMRAVYKRYVEGDAAALDALPDAS